MAVQVNKYEYDFLTGNWEGTHAAAYNSVREYCRERGWCDWYGETTTLGSTEVKKYREDENYLRIDVI